MADSSCGASGSNVRHPCQGEVIIVLFKCNMNIAGFVFKY